MAKASDSVIDPRVHGEVLDQGRLLKAAGARRHEGDARERDRGDPVRQAPGDDGEDHAASADEADAMPPLARAGTGLSSSSDSPSPNIAASTSAEKTEPGAAMNSHWYSCRKSASPSRTRSRARKARRDARAILGRDGDPAPVAVVARHDPMEFAARAGRRRQQRLARERRRGEHRRDRRPHRLPDPSRLVDDQERGRSGQRSDRPRSMSGRSPGRQRARPPRAVSSSVAVSRRKRLAAGDEQPVELAEQQRRLPQARRDDDRQAAAADEIGGLERDDGALAALPAAEDGEARIVGQEHVALPGIERQAGDPLGPCDGAVVMVRLVG